MFGALCFEQIEVRGWLNFLTWGFTGIKDEVILVGIFGTCCEFF